MQMKDISFVCYHFFSKMTHFSNSYLKKRLTQEVQVATTTEAHAFFYRVQKDMKLDFLQQSDMYVKIDQRGKKEICQGQVVEQPSSVDIGPNETRRRIK